ncbi:MAG: hypothetical protein WC296_02450 [Candidatus Izemoplasmatales bacterium]|jgi:hypothetical protein|nr:hypothetical protein [Candidatus Izemoplasmatales bacterium]
MLTLNDFILYFNIAFFGIIGLGVLGGLIQGFKKSLFTFVTMLIFYVIFFISIDMVVNQMWTMESSQIGVALAYADPAFANVTNFEDAVSIALTVYMGDTIDPSLLSADLLSLVGGIGIFALKIVYTILYFTVFLVIYKIICWIVRLIFGGKHDPHAAKNAGFGALIGLFNGIMALFVFLIMFGGVVDLVKSVTVILPEETVDESDSVALEFPRWELYEANFSLISHQEVTEAEAEVIPDDLLSMMKDMVTAYEANILVSAAGVITIPDASGTREIPLNLYLFDMVLSFKYNDTQIALRNEMSVFSEIGLIFMNSQFASTNEIGDLTSSEIQSVFTILANSDFIVSIMPLAIELAANYFEVDLGATPEQLSAIDWHTELITLGDITENIFIIMNAQQEGTDWSTLPEAIDGDFIRDLFTSMSDSALMIYLGEAFIEPYLSDPENTATAFLTIPANLDWSTEFLAIGEALGAIFDESDTFALAELGLDTIVNLTPVSIAKIFDSRILVATISTVLLNQDLGGMGLVIPDSVFDGDGYLTETELNALALSIQLIYNTTACAPEDDSCSQFDIAEVLSLDNTELNTLFGSEIISATMGKLILDMGTDVLAIPSTVIGSVTVDSIAVNVVTVFEIRKVFNALSMLGFDDFEFTSIGASILGELDDGTGNLDNTKVDALFESAIIQATISEILLDNLSTVPSTAKEMVGGIECITVTELGNAFKALYALGITDFAGENFTPTMIFAADFDIVLASIIVQANISQILLDNLPNIPDSVKVMVGDTECITVLELKNTFASLSELGITDFAGNNFTPATIFTADFDIVLASVIVHASISDTILNFATTSEAAIPGSLTLIVPTALRQDVTIDEALVTGGLIEINELKALLNSLSLLGFTDFSSGMSVDTIASMTGANLDSLLQSGSIHITIDNLAKGNSAVTGNIPTLALADLYGVDDVIIAAEIRNFILAANELGESTGSDFANVSISLAGVQALDSTSQGIVLDSMIVLNILTDDLETICSNPFNPFVLENSDYAGNDPLNFLTKATVIEIINFYSL